MGMDYNRIDDHVNLSLILLSGLGFYQTFLDILGDSEILSETLRCWIVYWPDDQNVLGYFNTIQVPSVFKIPRESPIRALSDNFGSS